MFVNFGNVKNAAKSDATNVTLDLTFNLVSFVGTMANDVLKAKIGGQDATLPGFTSVEPVSENISDSTLIFPLVCYLKY